ncbi:MAG: hypothetical protein HC868_11815 [Sphingomonadales bacterium]|nr:hypothetical protein [Sphingomonadales bacterium]
MRSFYFLFDTDLERDDLTGYEPILRGAVSVQQGWDEFRRALGLKV